MTPEEILEEQFHDFVYASEIILTAYQNSNVTVGFGERALIPIEPYQKLS